jgi:hypothetical protein
MARTSYEKRIKELMMREPHLTYLEASNAVAQASKDFSESSKVSKKPKESELQRLERQMNSLKKALYEPRSEESSNNIKVKISELERKIEIAKCNRKSRLDSMKIKIINGGSPGLGKRK